MRYTELLENKSKGKFVGVRFSPKTVNDLTRWMEKNNIPNATSPRDLHCTVLYSDKKVFPWKTQSYGNLTVDPSTFKLKLFGTEKNILVLAFKCPELEKRHKEGRKDHNLDWDFDEYIPHVTLSHNATQDVLDQMDLPTFPIKIGDEYTEDFEKETLKESDVDEVHQMEPFVDDTAEIVMGQNYDYDGHKTKQVGTIGDVEIYVEKWPLEDWNMFYFKQGDELVGEANVTREDIPGLKNVVKINTIYLKKQARGRTIGYLFYAFLLQNRFKILSDESHTVFSRAVWKKLADKYYMRVYNPNTGEIHDTNDIDEVYGNDNRLLVSNK